MSSELADVMKEGPVKIKGKHLGLWKTQWLQLYSASSRGPVRLEKYSSQEEAHQSVDDVHKPVPLTQINGLKRFATDGRKQAIEISFSSSQMQPFMFVPDNDTEAERWFRMLEQVRDTMMSEDSNSQQSMFHVYLMPTPNLSAHGECLLQVSSKDVSLYDSGEPLRLITKWPLSSLRRFGREGTKFTIESGRSSPTGEGIFVFNSHQNELIYQTVHRASTTIAESVRIARTTSERTANPGPVVPQRPVNLSFSGSPSPMSPAGRSPAGIPRGRSLDSASSSRGPLPPLPGT